MGAEAGMAAGLRVRAPAKINLYLEVLGRRPDGFHEISTVIQAVSLFDELEFSARPDGQVSLTCLDGGMPSGEENLVVRAARLLQRSYGVRQGASITLRKRIPVGAGLGGGSADCAVALLALRDLWGVAAPLDRLAELAAELGSDVPFFLWGGAAVCRGRGEQVTPLACRERVHLVLVMPGCHVSTGQVYRAFRTGLTIRDPSSNNVLRALECGDSRLLGRSLRNDLQRHSLELHPSLDGFWKRLHQEEVSRNVEGVLLSGSGSSFFAVARSEGDAERVATTLRSELAVPCAAVHSVAPWDGSLTSLAVGRAQR